MTRFFHAACIATALLAASPPLPAFADNAPRQEDEHGDAAARHEQRRAERAALLDARLVGLKASLALSADQEKNWPAFEAALRNFIAAKGGWKAKDEDASEGPHSPIDALRRTSQRLSARAASLNSLADAAAPLYASLDDKQKLVFGATAKGFWRRHRHERHWEH